VLAKKLKLPLGSYDVYVNIAGGLNLKEPSLDLAIATAVLSAFYDQPFKKSSLIFGEIGLAGELRAVIKTKERVKEAFRLGFKNIYLPKFETKVVNDKLNLKQLTDLNEVVKLFK
jgi:DNA repair protein RadA/Sms